jgi:release factor glutamine methyltransferase
MPVSAQLLKDAADRLAAAGIDTARLDARLLLAEALGTTAQSVFSHPDRQVMAAEQATFDALLARRLGREPISHILGRKGFWSLDLAVSPDTLAPRPDTESVVEAVLAHARDRTHPWRILDLGTGTGCILLALLAELPNASGLGIDTSPGALEMAIRNAESCDLADRARFQSGDWAAGLEGVFDIIVSNPPYIPEADIDGLDPEVARFEPRLALSGGADGLDCYRTLAPQLARLLAVGGIAALEVGQGQADDVAALLADAGLRPGTHRRDLGGIDRCVVAYP